MVRRSTKIAVGFAGKNEIEEFIWKLDHIQNKDFEKYIIAYIDFLGMTNRMRQKNSFDSLHILKFILSRAKKNAAFITGINTINDFEIKVFSDNVVIAQRVKKSIKMLLITHSLSPEVLASSRASSSKRRALSISPKEYALIASHRF